MSDQSQGPGWWVASDGKWYPPDQRPMMQPLEAAEGAVMWKVCPACSVATDTAGRFCPQCGASYERGAAGEAPARLAPDKDAPRPWAVSGVIVASIGWFFLGGYGLGPMLGLAGVGLASIGRWRNERNAYMVVIYGLVVTIITFLALASAESSP